MAEKIATVITRRKTAAGKHPVIGVSRERIRQIRVRLGIPKAKGQRADSVSELFRMLAPAEQERLAQMPASKIAEELKISAIRVYECLPHADAEPLDILSWDSLNWKLPNVDLIDVWRRDGRPHPIHFARRRMTDKRGESKWDGRSPARKNDPEWMQTFEQERMKAREFYSARDDRKAGKSHA